MTGALPKVRLCRPQPLEVVAGLPMFAGVVKGASAQHSRSKRAFFEAAEKPVASSACGYVCVSSCPYVSAWQVPSLSSVQILAPVEDPRASCACDQALATGQLGG